MKTLNAPGDLNIARVLRLVWQIKGISRIEIAQQLGLDKSTVTKIVFSLEDIGIVKAFAQGSSGPQGGRKPIQLKINQEFGYALGIEINPDGFRVVLANLHGEIVAYEGREMVVTSIFDAFDTAISTIRPELEKRKAKLIGVGVGIPGIVNTETGTIIRSIPLMIPDAQNFSGWAKQKYNVPIYIENDARCGCLGEITIRHGLNPENMMFVLSEIRRITGKTASKKNLSVGFGFILNGQPYYGNDFSAGEFRSILWKKGNSGQFRSNDISGDKIGYDTSVTDTVFTELSAHVALTANLLNLNHIYLGGLPEDLTRILAEDIRTEIVRKWPYEIPPKCEVTASTLGIRAVAYGAAGHCLQRFFSLPDIEQPSRNGPSIKEMLIQLRDV